MQASQPRLLDEVRKALRVRHYSIRTEESYISWIKRYIFYHHKQHPKDLGHEEITQFLSHLATERNVAASTQNQALSALLFLYKEVLQMELPWLNKVVRAKRPARLPVVLPRKQTLQLLHQLSGTNWLVANLLYGSGLRLMEAIRLRVKDVDFDYDQIIVRSGKGFKDRTTVLPTSLCKPLQKHLLKVKTQHQLDLDEGFGEVYLPFAIERKYPHANKEWGWQYVFPSSKRSVDPQNGVVRRHHISEKNLQRAIKQASRDLGITKPVSTHTLRHCFATHLLEDGYDIRTIQELLGHKDLNTTMIYTHVMKKGAQGVRSPIDEVTTV
jgi:integron integrase